MNDTRYTIAELQTLDAIQLLNELIAEGIPLPDGHWATCARQQLTLAAGYLGRLTTPKGDIVA